MGRPSAPPQMTAKAAGTDLQPVAPKTDQPVPTKPEATAAGPSGSTAQNPDVHKAQSSVPGSPIRDPPKIKIKRKAPWGKPQLRDSWSEDAMSRHDKDSVGARIKSEHRYNPLEPIRQSFKWGFVGLAIAVPTTLSLMYYYVFKRPIWKGDWQHILNIIRFFDTSPRSKLHYYYDPALEEHWPRKFARPPKPEPRPGS
jgi:hypothetical protein